MSGGSVGCVADESFLIVEVELRARRPCDLPVATEGGMEIGAPRPE